MTRRSELVSEELQEYLVAHSTPPDPVLAELAAETASRFPDAAGMQIGPEQGTFMTLLDAGHRCPQSPGDRHVHRLLGNLRRSRPGRGRPPYLLRRQRGVDIGGPEVLAAGRRS